MSLTTRTNWITGSYSSDVEYFLKIAENNRLRQNPNATNIAPQKDGEGIYYLDTFLGWIADFNNQVAERASLVDTLAVFRRTAEKTDGICEYRMTEAPKKSGVTP